MSKIDLPRDVKASDTKWPSYAENCKPWRTGENADLPLSLTFYKTTGFGWVLCTLNIRGAGRAATNNTARFYAVKVDDGQVCRVGHGPHVTAEVTVYLTASNIDRLRRYVELWRKGMADAGQIRDRISSRRAQGQLHRAAGRMSWTW